MEINNKWESGNLMSNHQMKFGMLSTINRFEKDDYSA